MGMGAPYLCWDPWSTEGPGGWRRAPRCWPDGRSRAGVNGGAPTAQRGRTTWTPARAVAGSAQRGQDPGSAHRDHLRAGYGWCGDGGGGGAASLILVRGEMARRREEWWGIPQGAAARSFRAGQRGVAAGALRELAAGHQRGGGAAQEPHRSGHPPKIRGVGRRRVGQVAERTEGVVAAAGQLAGDRQGGP